MREIKFRAFFDGTMVYGASRVGNALYWNNGKCFDMFAFKQEDPAILMQYTGVCDHNSRDIYEYDVLHWRHLICFSMKHGEIYECVYAKVVWSKGGTGFTLQHLGKNRLRTLDMCTSTVIGNSCENPELREGDMNERN